LGSLRGACMGFKGRRKEALRICPQVMQLALPGNGLVCLAPPTDRPEIVLLAISRLRRVLVESECEGNHTRVQLIVITAVWRKGKRRRKRKKKKKNKKKEGQLRLEQTASTAINIEAERQTPEPQSPAAIPVQASATVRQREKKHLGMQRSMQVKKADRDLNQRRGDTRSTKADGNEEMYKTDKKKIR
jgi:hypothetical protein